MGSFLPPGSFLMGSNHREASSAERPVRRVTLTRGFYLGIYPVTQAQWRAVMGTDPSAVRGDDRPVESVSWDDAHSFCAHSPRAKGAVVARLPTDAEWEWASRAGTTTDFYTGNGEAALAKAGWFFPGHGPVGGNAVRRAARSERLGTVRHARERSRVVRRFVHPLGALGRPGDGPHGPDERNESRLPWWVLDEFRAALLVRCAVVV